MPEETLQDDLKLGEALAAQAGELLLAHWARRDQLQVSEKRSGDFVSEADKEAEGFLRRALITARPDDGWLGEETGSQSAVRIGSRRRWIVDPLDGTTNFLHGIGHWAVSVALEIDGTPVLGVVHDPLRGETFTAIHGEGATLNGSPIVTSATRRFEAALFGTGIPFADMPHIDDHAADIARLAPRCAGVRRMGAAALDLAYVASGRFDGFWERRLQLWDIAAGLVLLREAGARVEGWSERERPEESGTVIAAAPQMFPDLAQILRQIG